MARCMLLQDIKLPGTIYRHSALDWSAENKICICTNKAIVILTPSYGVLQSGHALAMRKQVIPAPTEIMNLDTIEDREAFFSTLKKNDMYEVMLDHTLSPMTVNALPFLGFRLAHWSPKGVSGRCLLATLTMDHRLSLFVEKGDDWSCVWSLSKDFLDLYRSWGEQDKIFFSDFECDPSALEVLKLKEKTYGFAAMEIVWTNMFGIQSNGSGENINEWCYLISAMRNGDILWWKISQCEKNMVSLDYTWNTNLGTITSLCWQQTSINCGFLVVGSLKGQLLFAVVSLQVEAKENPRLVVKEVLSLWKEEDRIAVDNIVVLKTGLRKYVIVATKQQYLIYSEVVLTDTNVTICKSGYTTGCHKLPVTGLAAFGSSMPQSHFILTSMEGKIVKIRLVSSASEIEFQHEELNVDTDLQNLMIQGVRVSPNGVLTSMVLKSAVLFDHLEVREPVRFVMFLSKSFEEAMVELHNLLKPQLLPTSPNNITKYADYMDCVAACIAVGSEIPEWLSSLLKLDLEGFESQLTQLYFTRFLLKCVTSAAGESVNSQYGNLELKLEKIDSILMRNYIYRVVGSCQDKLDLLAPLQCRSLLLMVDFLFKEYDLCLETVYSTFGLESPSDSKMIPAREVCRICKLEVKFENLKYGECLNKHKFARCSQSLLLCDVNLIQSCPSCKSVASSQEVWNISSTCTFCCSNMSHTLECYA